jgi:hypothetical protein
MKELFFRGSTESNWLWETLFFDNYNSAILYCW